MVFTEQTGAADPFNGLDIGYSTASVFADLDGDGDLDLISGARGGPLQVCCLTSAPVGLI